MLLNHIERVQQKSDNYKQIYTLSVSVLFTALVASVWVMSLFSVGLNFDGNQASVKGAVDGAVELSPASVVKTETGNIFGSFVDSLKSFTGKTFLGDKYKVEFKDGFLGMTPSEEVSVQNDVGVNSLSDTISTTTSSGITVEVDVVK